jgi:hypothetical protein
MAVQRLTLTQIKTELLRIAGGYDGSTSADWLTDANLYRIVNLYLQRLPARCAQVARELKLPVAGNSMHFTMWRRSATATTSAGEGNLVVVAGSSTVTIPTDHDETISWYDETDKRLLTEVTNVDKYDSRLRDLPPGPPVVVEMTGISSARKTGKFYPATKSGVTPVITLTYFGLPAKMAGSAPDTEYPDIGAKWESLSIYGPALELTRPSSPTYDRYAALERELLVDLAFSSER